MKHEHKMPDGKVHYVVGFAMFKLSAPLPHSKESTDVLLMHKTHPPWQFGLFNGVGGVMEPDETMQEAMSREFLQEANCLVPADRWRYMLTISYPHCEIHVLKVDVNPTERSYIKTVTAESVQWFDVRYLPGKIVFDLTWMIPMMFDTELQFPIRLDRRVQ